MVFHFDDEKYEVFCIAPSLVRDIPQQGSFNAPSVTKKTTIPPCTRSSRFQAGERVAVRGTRITGTLVEYVPETGYWVIKRPPCSAVEREYQPETSLVRL